MIFRSGNEAATASRRMGRVVEPDPLPAWLACPDAAGPGVEQQHQAELLAALVKGPVSLVIGREGLDGRMQLDAFQPEVGDARQLINRALALERVHAAEADERVRMISARLCNQLVGNSGPATGRFGVPREQDREDVERLVIARQLLERPPRHLGAKVSLCRLDVSPHRHIEPFGRRQVNVEVDRFHSGSLA